MRNFFRPFVATIACALSVVGCSSEFDIDKSDYEEVYPGITMYSFGAISSEIALDGVSLSMRLGLLLNEMDAYNDRVGSEKLVFVDRSSEEPDWTLFDDKDEMFEYTTGKFANKKEFLIGFDDEVTIEKEDGVYILAYGRTVTQGDPDWSDYDQEVELHTKAMFDNMIRRGTIYIETNGCDRLEDTDIHHPWYVYSNDGAKEPGMTYAMALSPQTKTYECRNIGGESKKGYKVWMDESEGKVYYEISGSKPNYYQNIVDSDWDMKGYTKMNLYTKFDLESTFFNYYTLEMNGLGTPLANSSASKVGMTFSTPEPIKYKPSTTLSFTKYSGDVEVTIDKATTKYPYRTVYIKFSNVGGWRVTYGATTYYGR